MRTAPPSLLPLFRSDMQVSLLGLLILQPGRTWTLHELARTLAAPESSVHRELARAVDAGIAVRDRRSRPHRYEANVDSPAYSSLRELLEQTVGMPERLRHALATVDGVHAAAIHGSWATGKPGTSSDVDVIAIAEGDPIPVRRALRQAGRKVGREIDLVVFGSDEFDEMARLGNPFVERILQGPRIDLVGDLAKPTPS